MQSMDTGACDIIDAPIFNLQISMVSCQKGPVSMAGRALLAG